MPRVQVNGISLHYETTGSGTPVLLIAGLGADHHFWYRQIPALAERFRVIAPDNRGAGESDKPDARYTLRQMADDLRALLDALEVPSAHVMGASLGGFLAQEFILAYPERTRRVVLCCTSFGGAGSAPIPPQTLAVLMTRTGDPERDLRATLTVQFAGDFLETHAEEIDAYVAWRVAHPQPVHAYRRQLEAALAHDTQRRVGELRMPVLVLHGRADRVVPAMNGERLAAAIPGARLSLLEAGHNFLWEASEEANRQIIDFLSHDDVAWSEEEVKGERTGSV
jgi:pimeloyl-ACP methyl ester carboxylesterase